MTEPFRTTRRVEFADTDMAGIAHFSQLLPLDGVGRGGFPRAAAG